MLPGLAALIRCGSAQVCSRGSLAAHIWMAAFGSAAFGLSDADRVPAAVGPEAPLGRVDPEGDGGTRVCSTPAAGPPVAAGRGKLQMAAVGPGEGVSPLPPVGALGPPRGFVRGCPPGAAVPLPAAVAWGRLNAVSGGGAGAGGAWAPRRGGAARPPRLSPRCGAVAEPPKGARTPPGRHGGCSGCSVPYVGA